MISNLYIIIRVKSKELFSFAFLMNNTNHPEKNPQKSRKKARIMQKMMSKLSQFSRFFSGGNYFSQRGKVFIFSLSSSLLPLVTRGRKLINKLVINKLEKFKFFHVGKNNSHPRKNEKNRENGLNFVMIFLHYSCVFFDFSLENNSLLELPVKAALAVGKKS